MMGQAEYKRAKEGPKRIGHPVKRIVPGSILEE
jgi:hypothetical protein